MIANSLKFANPRMDIPKSRITAWLSEPKDTSKKPPIKADPSPNTRFPQNNTPTATEKLPHVTGARGTTLLPHFSTLNNTNDRCPCPIDVQAPCCFCNRGPNRGCNANYSCPSSRSLWSANHSSTSHKIRRSTHPDRGRHQIFRRTPRQSSVLTAICAH